MIRPIIRARSRPQLAAASLKPFALWLMRAVGPLYARLALRYRSLSFVGEEHLVAALDEFYAGKARLLLAFRHPFGDEPQAMAWALSRLRRGGVPSSSVTKLVNGNDAAWRRRPWPHCLFLHGYEVPLWSGPLVRWLLPRIGALPVYHVRVDGEGIRRTRQIFRDGLHPLALAPEGQSSYRSESLPRLERGAIQLGFWCAEELAAAGRSEEVKLLPISVHARRRDADFPALLRLAEKLERRFGLDKGEARAAQAVDAERSGGRETTFIARRALGLRLRRIDAFLLAQAAASYGLTHPACETARAIAAGAGLENAALASRWACDAREALRAAIIEAALARGEASLGLEAAKSLSTGDAIARVYRIRHAGWSRIFPERDLSALSAFERELADLRAGEAWYAMRHMELVDLLWYLDTAYLEAPLAEDGAPSIERLAETLDNLVDLSYRLAGGNITNRPRELGKDIVLVMQPPLEFASRRIEYLADRRAALARATADLAAAYGAAVEAWHRAVQDSQEGGQATDGA